MNSLLKRQVRKYLGNGFERTPEVDTFLDAVDKSYNTFDEQFCMVQRATTISSEELFRVNAQLREEMVAQKNLIAKLKKVLNTFNAFKLPETDEKDEKGDSSELIDLISSQTQQILAMNEQKEKLLSDLSRQNEELNDFAHIVSHDLRSPLRSIEALTTWLKEDYEGVIDEKGFKDIEMIRNNVVKMDTLIGGILEYSTIGRTQIKSLEVDLNELMDEIRSIIYLPKNIQVLVKGKLPSIRGNKYRLQQLFQNIIDNAVKYNDKEKGIIEVSCVDKDEFWEFAIKDNGKGIEKTYFEKIFKIFQKLENTPNSIGIGLSIVKKIVSIHKGKIWLDSELNVGTTFYFTLKKEY